MDFTSATNFLKDFGLPLGMAILFQLMLISKPRNSTNPYLVPGSALDSKDRELDSVRSSRSAIEERLRQDFTSELLEWKRLREEERNQRIASDLRLQDTIHLVTELTRVVQEIRLELVRQGKDARN